MTADGSATVREMQSLIDFDRRSPLMTMVLVLCALAVAVLTVAFGSGGILLPIVFALLIGLLAGIVVAVVQRRDN